MKSEDNPFLELIDVLKHNGYSNAPLTELTGPRFLKLLQKAGWDEAWSGLKDEDNPEKGKTHLLGRMREATRGQECGIVTLLDFARALESGIPMRGECWYSARYGAQFIVNWKKKRFVTFFPLSARRAWTVSHAKKKP